MERLRDYTKRVARRLDIDSALSILSKHYFSGSKPRRFISGVAISSREPDSHGISLVAKGVDFSLPTPLLWNHEWIRPLGRVTGVDICGDQVLFRAEIANDMPWVEQIWQEIIKRNADRVSIEGHSLDHPVIERTYTHWQLTEISITQHGADKGAVVNKVWERMPVLYCDARPTEKLHWENWDHRTNGSGRYR